MIRLNDLNNLNAINPHMADKLVKIWHDINQDGNVWVVIISGEGTAMALNDIIRPPGPVTVAPIQASAL